MVNLRKRTRTPDPKPKEEAPGYEKCRDERIKENMERMKKLGILDLSVKLKSELLPPKRTPISPSERKTAPRSPLFSSGPPRRSSRLQNVTPVSYSELPTPRREKSLENSEIVLNEGSRPEFYSEEHEKLLGTCESSWTLFVDGYGKDGKRIYDPVNGKTCHQCRQKTLGHHTHCIKCNLVQGQFCGDCLYMRYGEHVLEAIHNPNWICPVCRGICNCSLCRQSKGWAPTGALYKKVSRLGFKSVAHYLIQTRRPQTNSEGTCNDDPVSAKMSLPFSDGEDPSLKTDNDHHGSKDENEFKGERKGIQSSDIKHDIIHVALESDAISKLNPTRTTRRSLDNTARRLRQKRDGVDGHDRCSKPVFEDNDDEFTVSKDELILDNKQRPQR